MPALLLCALLLGAPAAAQDPNYVYSIPSTIVGVGGCFTTQVHVDNSAGLPLRGWQMAVCHELGKLVALTVDRGISFESALFLGPPWFESVTFGTGGWNAGAVLDQNGFITLPSATSHELYQITYGAVSGGTATTLDFCALATTGPPISELVTTDTGDTIVPTTIPGFVTITAAPGACNDTCETAIPLGDGSTPYHLGAATPDSPDLAFPCGVDPDRDVWFCYTATCDGFAKVQLGGNGFAAVYSGCSCPADVAALLVCGPLGPGLGGDVLTFPVTTGSQYLVQVGTSPTLPLGSTSGMITISCDLPECVLPDNGAGTINLPPVGCAYDSAGDLHGDADGFPEALIDIAITQSTFTNVFGPFPGGSLSGDVVTFDSQLALSIEGFGAFAGYTRLLSLPAPAVVVDLAPRPLGAAVQGFDTALMQLEAILTSDPDFTLLRITAGGNNALPSPGFTTARLLPGGGYAVDSFFDVSYEVEFIGAPGGPFAGRLGTTTDTVRLELGNGLSEVPRFVRGDANLDSSINVGDTIAVLAQLFSSATPLCRDASDANDDGSMNVADPVFILTFLFQTGALPPEPSLVCGVDPTQDTLDCADDSGCP
ncbi:MAG: hypothetical protein AAF581_14175 [Planctomycetota bacterium]